MQKRKKANYIEIILIENKETTWNRKSSLGQWKKGDSSKGSLARGKKKQYEYMNEK